MQIIQLGKLNELAIRNARFLTNILALESKRLIMNLTMNLRLSRTATDQTGNARGQNCLKNRVSRSGALRETCVWLIIWMPIKK